MFIKKLIPALTWAVVIMVLCGIPGRDIPELTFLQWLKPDKIVHLVIFGILCYLLLVAFRSEQAPAALHRNAIAIAVISTIAYGALTEILQTYVFIQRNGDVRDALANALGAVLGAWIFIRRQNARKA